MAEEICLSVTRLRSECVVGFERKDSAVGGEFIGGEVCADFSNYFGEVLDGDFEGRVGIVDGEGNVAMACGLRVSITFAAIR